MQDDLTEQINRATRKNATLDMASYETLAQHLEYFDLRELQTAVIWKKLWPQFETVFENKEALTVKFDQLAELINSLRHSRAVTGIVRKEREAAIIWFEHMLAKPSENNLSAVAHQELIGWWLR